MDGFGPEEDTGLGAYRALVLALAGFIGLVVLFVFVPDWLLRGLPWGERGARVWLATGWVGAAFFAVGYSGWRSTVAPEPPARKASP